MTKKKTCSNCPIVIKHDTKPKFQCPLGGGVSARNGDEEACDTMLDIIIKLGKLRVANAKLEKLANFVEAFDIWAASEELCGGVLFDAMLEARDASRYKRKELKHV